MLESMNLPKFVQFKLDRSTHIETDLSESNSKSDDPSD